VAGHARSQMEGEVCRGHELQFLLAVGGRMGKGKGSRLCLKDRETKTSVCQRGHGNHDPDGSRRLYVVPWDVAFGSRIHVQKGGPLAWNIPDPVPTGFIKFAMLKKGKHPNAARVFLGGLEAKGSS